VNEVVVTFFRRSVVV